MAPLFSQPQHSNKETPQKWSIYSHIIILLKSCICIILYHLIRPDFLIVVSLLLVRLFHLSILIIWRGLRLIDSILIVWGFGQAWLILQCCAISFVRASFIRFLGERIQIQSSLIIFGCLRNRWVIVQRLMHNLFLFIYRLQWIHYRIILTFYFL